MTILAEGGGENMDEGKSWLTTNYTGCNYDSDIDNDLAQARRRKALAELKGLIREKHIQQINKILSEI